MEFENFKEVYCLCNKVVFLPLWVDGGIKIIPLGIKQDYGLVILHKFESGNLCEALWTRVSCTIYHTNLSQPESWKGNRTSLLIVKSM